jgi:serine/threonine protein kinase
MFFSSIPTSTALCRGSLIMAEFQDRFVYCGITFTNLPERKVQLYYDKTLQIPVIIKMTTENSEKERKAYQLAAESEFIVNVVCFFTLKFDKRIFECLVLEYIPGPDLFDVIDSRSLIYCGDLRQIMVWMVEGLADLHARGVYPLDISPENILIEPGIDDGKKFIKGILYCDFAEAEFQKTYRVYRKDIPKQKLYYRAPEVHDCQQRLQRKNTANMLLRSYSDPELQQKDSKRTRKMKEAKKAYEEVNAEKADIWALGVTFYALVTRQKLYETPTLLGKHIDPCIKILKNACLHDAEKLAIYSLLLRVPNLCFVEKRQGNRSQIASFLSKMLHLQPSKRWTARQLLQHRWLSTSGSS